jgi:seryl-tRNA synthetase
VKDLKELSKISTRYSNRLDEMKVDKKNYTVDFSQEINDIQKSLDDTIKKLKDLGKKLDTKATSQFPNYPKDAIHRRKPDTIDGQVFANGEHEFAVKPMIDWLEGNNKYWSGLKYQLSKPVKAYPTNSRGKVIELDK